MAELTKEQLIEEAKLKIAIAKCHPNSGVARVEGELFKIAETSLEAEPIAWECGENIILFNPDTVEAYAKRAEISPKPLFSAPPALVVPDKLSREHMGRQPCHQITASMAKAIALKLGAELNNEEAEIFADGYNAAVLHDAEPVSQNDKLPELSDNYPVTPDSWISCSERMPEDGQHVIILCDGAFVLYAQYRDGEFFDIVRNGDEFFETQSRNVTDWMPLPEPPQEVN
ncbi:DUF551 domain-containing protein [Escherichia coli]|nr:DUF551 domain-containing protein [Escherichia coli]EME2919354.1 DUF551 domain-containing protein [Escherichia coli]